MRPLIRYKRRNTNDPCTTWRRTTAQAGIKDGAFCSVTSDWDNNGTINKADYDKRHDPIGSLLLLNSTETAEFYAWIKNPGEHVYSVSFAGVGGVEYAWLYNDVDGCVYDTNTPWPTLEADTALTGTVTVNGKDNSADIQSGKLSIDVTTTTGAPSGSDWTRFSVFSVMVDMAFNHNRADNTGSNGINIRTDGSADTKHYGAELVQNSGAGWVHPNGNVNQGTVLYVADKDVTIYNRFQLTLPIDVSINLEAASGFSFGGCQEKAVSFVGGVSSGGKDVSGVSGFVEFATLGKTSAAINKEISVFTWNATKIQTKTNGIGKATETGEATFYTVLDVPKTPPWNPADGVGDTQQPWVTALEFTVADAGTMWCAQDTEALSTLTFFLHSVYGLMYDTTSGAAKYFVPHYTDPINKTGFLGYKFEATAYINKTNGRVVNCYDQAAAVTVFGRLLGIDVQFAYSNPFGFINTTTLVGNIVTNNPFGSGPFDIYYNPLTNYERIEHTDTAGIIVEERTFFGNHAFAVLNATTVYDACAGPILGLSEQNYYDTVIDFEANKQYNLKNWSKYGRNVLGESSAEISFVYVTITYLM